MIYTVIIQNEKKTEAREYPINITDLLRKNDKYDSLNIDSDGKVTITRRIGIYQGDTYILSNEIIQKYDDINLVLFEGINYIYLKDDNNTVLSVSYVLKNDYTNVFTTRVEMGSKITQTAQEINFEVVNKVNEDEIIAKISQSVEEIKILANKISMEGLVTVNGKFKINLDGSAETTDLRLADGGKAVTNQGIYTKLQFKSGFKDIGFYYSLSDEENIKTYMDIYITIPTNFQIESANIKLIHEPTRSYLSPTGKSAKQWYWGYARNIGIFNSGIDDFYEAGSMEYDVLPPTMDLIERAFDGKDTWQPSAASSSSHFNEEIISKDISSYLQRGKTNRIVITSNDDVPEATADELQENIKNAQKTGHIYAVATVFGYMNVKENNETEENNDL